MSKAVIVSHLGDAKYRVKLQIDLNAVNARIKTLETRIQTAADKIAGELQTAVDTTLAALNAITVPDGTIDPGPELDQLMAQLDAARSAYDKAVNALNREKITRENASSEKGKLEAYDSEIERDLWCADYTTSLKSGSEVGVIDIYQFRGRSTPGDQIIIPAYLTGKESQYNKVRDGRNVPQGSLSANSWWCSMMLVAGMERFNPHYRKGEITAINDDGTVNVTVDDIYTQAITAQAEALTSSETNLVNVPVRYLICNAGAFELGDRVVIEYPRKNIHKGLAASFAATRTALQSKYTELTTEISAINTQIAMSDALIIDLQAAVNAKIDALNIILATEDHTQGEVDNANMEIDLAMDNLLKEQRRNDSLQDSVLELKLRQAATDLQITKLQAAENQEMGNYAVLKAYTDTRPQEITVIGFVENPRPCQGIAFKNSAGAWMMAKPNGKEYPLSTAPALSGAFNWGVKDKSGFYDCACVWNASTVRHGGNNYAISGANIKAACVTKTIPDPSAPERIVYTIVMVRLLSGALKMTKTVVKEGSIVSTKDTALTGATPPLTPTLYLADSLPDIDHTEILCSDVVIDKTGDFAIYAYKERARGIYAYGTPKWYDVEYDNVYYIDLANGYTQKLTSTSIERWIYSPEAGVEPMEMGEGLAVPRGTSSELYYAANTLTQNADGAITMIAGARIPPSSGLSAEQFEYSLIEFSKLLVYKKLKTLYQDTQTKKFLGIWIPLSTIPQNVYYTGHETHQILAIIPKENDYATIKYHYTYEGTDFIPDPGNVTVSYDIAHTRALEIIGFDKPFEEVAGSEFIVVSGGLQIRVYAPYLYPQPRAAGDYTAAMVPTGFMAGCVKLGNTRTPKMWVEFRGSKWKIVDKPSTDYTIYI